MITRTYSIILAKIWTWPPCPMFPQQVVDLSKSGTSYTDHKAPLSPH